MTVFVNGQPHTLPDGAPVALLIEQLKLGEKRVAVEVNTELVTKSEWPARVLHDGDKLEIVSFVGGG